MHYYYLYFISLYIIILCMPLELKVTDVTDTTSSPVMAVNRADAYFEQEVVLPLQEIGQRLDYRLMSLKDIYQIQSELLAGKLSTATTTNTNTATNGGLQKKIDQFEKDRDTLITRVEDIKNKTEEQKERVQNALQLISLLRTKVSFAF